MSPYAGSRQLRGTDEAQGIRARNRVPDRNQLTWREIGNAGHFAFLSPFSPRMRNPGFLPSTDPEGFDRERLHERLPGEILEFLNDQLP